MSGRGRGGRGRGGRGGYGAARRTGPQGMPGADDPTLQFDEKPQDTYPKTYEPPVAPPLETSEERSVAAFIAFRKAFHSTPFYTHRHLMSSIDEAATSNPTEPVRRTYGQAQVNARFGVKTRATADPFHAVPLYSKKFQDQTRTIPELKKRADKYVRDFFPEELWATLYGKDTGGPRGGFLNTGNGVAHKRVNKPKAVVVDGDPFASDDEVGGLTSRQWRKDETEEERKARIENALKEGDIEDPESKEDIDLDEEEQELSQEDDDYGDDEGGDYDAEAYFDAGDADDYGDDDGVGESAMDF
ncbi:DNA-directed RNA polymerase III, subunit Rpc31 [Hypoxylon sp. FL0890]|nr:DNA-directed RNA polymerase III, subunit Rpc31 [Hypoxylon sp. FL0890]